MKENSNDVILLLTSYNNMYYNEQTVQHTNCRVILM